MRPDVIAFRELDTLVRNLGDQLAGYRRRAMAAEARTRELESLLTASQGALTAARSQMVEVEQTLGTTLRARTKAESDAAAASSALAAHIAAIVPPPAPVIAEDGRIIPPGEVALRTENEALHVLLSEARERTGQLIERARFLRQQVESGAER